MSPATAQPVILTITYRTPVDGEEALMAWLGRLRAGVATSPGFLGAGVDTAQDGDICRVVTSYKFAASADIDNLLASPAWASLQSDLPVSVVGEPVQTRSGEAGGTRTSEVISASVPPGGEQEYQNRRAALDAAAAAFPGFVSIDVFEPGPGEQVWNTVLTFDSMASLQAWRDSAQRQSLVSEIQQVAPDQVRVAPTGFGQWFSVNATATAQAPAWKQAMTVMAVLYAMVSVLNITLGNLVGTGFSFQGEQLVPGLGLPFPVVVFIGNAVGTILLTWVLMPIVTRLLAWWLDPGCTRAQTVGGILLMLAIYVAEMILFVWVFRTFAI